MSEKVPGQTAALAADATSTVGSALTGVGMATMGMPWVGVPLVVGGLIASLAGSVVAAKGARAAAIKPALDALVAQGFSPDVAKAMIALAGRSEAEIRVAQEKAAGKRGKQARATEAAATELQQRVLAQKVQQVQGVKLRLVQAQATRSGWIRFGTLAVVLLLFAAIGLLVYAARDGEA